MLLAVAVQAYRRNDDKLSGMIGQHRKLLWVWARVLGLVIVLCLTKVSCDALYNGLF